MKRKSIVLSWTFSFLLCSAYGLYYARETKLEGLERSVSADRETVSQDDERRSRRLPRSAISFLKSGVT